jgi:hypothetical protein
VTTTPLAAANARNAGAPAIDLRPQFPAGGEGENSDAITYAADPSKRHPGFRKVDIQVPDGGKLRVRKRAGYRIPIP